MSATTSPPSTPLPPPPPRNGIELLARALDQVVVVAVVLCATFLTSKNQLDEKILLGIYAGVLLHGSIPQSALRRVMGAAGVVAVLALFGWSALR